VVFADDWGRHPSSCQHLFARIAQRRRVVWVNTIGTRTPTLSRADLARAAGKLRDWVRAPVPAGSVPVRVVRPVMIPFEGFAPARRFNASTVGRAVRAALAQEPPGETILVTTIPGVAPLVGRLGEDASVYYCVDELSEWPGADRDVLVALEAELLAKVDLVVATSARLFEDKSARHARVRLLPHGVDWEAFRAGRGRAPEALLALPRPRLGFVGLADGRLDVALLDVLAASLPDASFVLLGPRQLAPGPLDRRANVHFLPPVAYADVPAVMHALDCGVLPYVRDALTARMNPLKLRELLASGTPVVSARLPEVEPYRAVVHLAEDVEEWRSAIAAALADGRRGAERRAAAVREEGWDRRSEEFERLAAGALPRERSGR
jgi:glycosyltransferase involved in cell wall biosynthesis